MKMTSQFVETDTPFRQWGGGGELSLHDNIVFVKSVGFILISSDACLPGVLCLKF